MCATLVVLAYGAPLLAWYGFVVALNGQFFHHDIGTGGFQWMAHRLETEGLNATLHAFGLGAVSIASGALAQGWPVIIALAGLMSFCGLKNARPPPPWRGSGKGLWRLLCWMACFSWPTVSPVPDCPMAW